MRYATWNKFSVFSSQFSVFSGFTLIETIIAVTIIGMLAAGVTSSYGNFNKKQKLKQAALTVKNDLRQTQTRASSSEIPTSGCTKLTSYQATFYASTPAQYVTSAVCTDPAATITIATVTLSQGISVSSGSIDFYPLGAPAGSDVTITLTLGSDSCTIQVLRNGTVEDLGCI